jgi:hypothetical protein
MTWKCFSVASKFKSESDQVAKQQQESELKILQACKDSNRKLEMIEEKYSAENQRLKEKLEEATEQLKIKNSEIKKQKKTIKNLESLSNTVNEAVCPKCNISLEDSMVFRKEDMHEVDTDKMRKIEEALHKKSMELDQIFKHLEERNNQERMFKMEIQNKSQYIIQLEKDKYNLVNDNKQLRADRSNFLEQLKELQESVKVLKSKSSANDKLMMDAYIQTGAKVCSISTQAGPIEDEEKEPEPLKKPKIHPEIPSNQKKKPLAKKPSKKGLVKRPPSKLSFSRNQSASAISSQSSPPQSSFCESESNFSHTVASSKDNEMLANEIIILNREVTNLKSQLRKSKFLF